MSLSARDRIERDSVPEPNSGCWLWLRAVRPKSNGDYGVLWTGDKLVGAHRFSFEAFTGPIPDGLYVCHSCDNPICVNPEHLFVGTQRENLEDCDRKGRWPSRGGAKNGNAKITEADVAEMRRLRREGHKTLLIAYRFGISWRAAQAICAGTAWQHVEHAA